MPSSTQSQARSDRGEAACSARAALEPPFIPAPSDGCQAAILISSSAFSALGSVWPPCPTPQISMPHVHRARANQLRLAAAYPAPLIRRHQPLACLPGLGLTRTATARLHWHCAPSCPP